jgi:hypothetical protein
MCADQAHLYVATGDYILILSAPTGDEMGIITCASSPTSMVICSGLLYWVDAQPDSVVACNLQTRQIESRHFPAFNHLQHTYCITRSGANWYLLGRGGEPCVYIFCADDWQKINRLPIMSPGFDLAANSRFLFVRRRDDILFFDLEQIMAAPHRQGGSFDFSGNAICGAFYLSGNAIWCDEKHLFVQTLQEVVVARLPGEQ